MCYTVTLFGYIQCTLKWKESQNINSPHFILVPEYLKDNSIFFEILKYFQFWA